MFFGLVYLAIYGYICIDMNIHFDIETVRARHSVRQFTDEPLSSDQKETMSALISECNAEGGIHLQLVTDEPHAYGRSMMAKYGKFSGVRNYVCLVARKGDDAEEALGYYGEMVVLKAQELGLNTCWCGLSYSKRNVECEVAKDEIIHGLIALGHGVSQGVQHRSKSAEMVSEGYNLAASWFRNGVDCALLAPTAVNQQKFHFEYCQGNKVKATTGSGFYSHMDLGIAKLHFEIGADCQIDWITE